MSFICNRNRRRYNIRLKYPHLPCVCFGNKKNSTPMELCEVLPGQRVSRERLGSRHVEGAMLKALAVQPSQRADVITKVVRELAPRGGGDALSESAFGIELGGSLLSVDARILPLPTLQYGGRHRLEPERDGRDMLNGSWNVLSKTLLEPMSLAEGWMFLNCSGTPSGQVSSLLSEIERQMASLGMRSTRAEVFPADPQDSMARVLPKLLRRFEENNGKRKPAAIVALLPDGPSNADMYSEIKYFGNIEFCIPTQCMLASKAFKSRNLGPYVANCLLKLNCKLGGENHKIQSGGPGSGGRGGAGPSSGGRPDNAPAAAVPWNGPTEAFGWFTAEPYLIIAADVAHPKPGQPGAETADSIASVCVSLDPNANKYLAQVALQGARQEVITSLRDAALRGMQAFQQGNGGAKPVRILFLRDGVSDGQFSQVLEDEVPLLRAAYRDAFGGADQPPITVVTCQKNHNMRFFGQDDRGGLINLCPGVVFDREITHPTQYDFFMYVYVRKRKAYNFPRVCCVVAVCFKLAAGRISSL